MSGSAAALALRRAKSPWFTRLGIIGVLIAIVALYALASRKTPIAVRVIKVERGTVRDEVSSSVAGEIVPAQHATVRTELPSRVIAVRHKRGDRVAAGESIVVIDGQDLAARVAQAQATLATAQANVEATLQRAQLTRRATERAKTLADRGAGTTQLSEDSATQAQESEDAVRAAKSQVAQAEAGLKMAQVQKGKASLNAPFAGVLVEVIPDVGEQLPPNASVFEIIDDRELHVEASIDEADAARVVVGQPATLSLDALPGTLSKIGPAVRKDLKGERTLPVEVAVTDVAAAKQLGVRAGMSANVEIIVKEKRNAVFVPTNVIVGRGTRRTVFAVEHGHARVKTVTVGLANWDRSEILSGIAVGDEIIATLNVKDLEDGVPLKVEVATP